MKYLEVKNGQPIKEPYFISNERYNELVKKYDTFIVKIIQVYYNDNYDIYQAIKEEITKLTEVKVDHN